jgi:hypothetical protein
MPGVLDGIVTTSETIPPFPLYKVLVPVPLLDTQNGLVELAARPHGLVRFGSVTAA